VCIESRCAYINAIDRTKKYSCGFKCLELGKNGVLLYIAMKDHQLAILLDEGIH